ncbi:hypothetical protein [Burkholderia pyrrocinia]|uniref:hypothetical protein n=1 Tax=Burkholderia pyrrocinia TaxID=60550 RepID=UPI00158C28AF|nr:hypothetical protein [Burkholderia pyrrocinia]
MQGKYNPITLLPALRLFIEARNRAIASDFTDNGGAIHSVERILDILCQRVRYPNLSHINNLKTDPDAECSVGAHKARQRGEKVLIEHVMPQREFAREVIKIVDNGATDDQILSFIRRHYRLVLLTQEETTALNRLNRSRMTPDRLADAGIEIFRATS